MNYISQDFNQDNAIEYVVDKMSAILLEPQERHS